MSDKYADFLEHLTDPQVRALASQSGINSWVNEDTNRLRELLMDHKSAEVIYRENH